MNQLAAICIYAKVAECLSFAEAANQPRPQHNAQEKRRQAGKRCAKGRIAEDPEGTYIVLELLV